jgi:hypothetical protein
VKPVSTPQPELRRLRRDLTTAADEQIARVVAMLDRLPDRGEADQVLDPLRPRLRTLKPPRPLNLPRLLFMPLEGALVAPTAWRRGGPEVPRNAIRPIADAVLAANPSLAAIATACLSADARDAAGVMKLGRPAWAAAAAAIGRDPPPDWAATGLRDDDFRAITAICVPLWRHAEALQSAVAASEDGPPDGLLRAALTPLAGDAFAFQAAVATLLRKATKPGGVVACASAIGPAAGPAAERALDGFLDGCMPVFATEDLAGTAAAARSLARALEDVENSAAGRHLDRRRRLHALRATAATACRSRHAEVLTASVLAQLTGKPATPPDMVALEETARDLRRIEAAGRRLGDAGAYDRAARDATDSLSRAARECPDMAERIEIARLAEILVGSDAAEAMLR